MIEDLLQYRVRCSLDVPGVRCDWFQEHWETFRHCCNPGRLKITLSLSVMTMKILVRLASFLTVMLTSLSLAWAQTPQDARITASHPGFGALKSDLKALIDLTLPAEKTQWENIEGYIDTFAIGVDEARPVFVSVLTGLKPTANLIWAPLPTGQQLFKDFRENLESLGYELVRDAKDHTLYRLEQDPEYGWVRVLSDIQYAVFVISEDKASLPALKELILKAQLPKVKIEGNMMAELVNDDASPEAQKHRKAAFDEVRRMGMEPIKKRPEESNTDFELRKLAVVHQMNEGERLLAETARLFAVLNMDKKAPGAPAASLSISATAIPGSSLAAAIEEIGKQPDAFAGIAKFEGSALSGRLNHPIDPMRQANFLEFVSLTEKNLMDRIKASKTLSDAEKQNSSDVGKGVMDVVRAGIKSGWTNGFIESVPDGKGDFVTIAAVSTPAATQLNTVLPGLAKAGAGSIVEMNLDKQGDINIHRVQLAEGFVDIFDKVFGVKKELFIGVGPTHVWLASGVNSKDVLKKTIAGLGTPQSTTTPLHVEVKFLPWIQRFDEIAKTDPPGKTTEELEGQREKARRRARAIASFANGADGVVVDFKVVNGEVKGLITLETGLLRLAGKMMSAFSHENFE